MTEPSTATLEPERAKRASAMPPDVRRSMIVDATLPLLLERGTMVTTRQIADAAGIAEGTIFRAFEDKDALIEAVVERACDAQQLEHALRDIDPTLPFEDALVAAIVIMQQRVVDIWRLVSSCGSRVQEQVRRPMTESETLASLFEAHQDRIQVAPRTAAKLLRALTLSVTHPMLVDEPMGPAEVVELFLNGVSTRRPAC